MARDEPLDDGLTKSLFSGISRPRPESQKPKSEVQSSSSEEQISVSIVQTSEDARSILSSEVQTSSDVGQTPPVVIQSPKEDKRTATSVVQSSEVDKKTPATIAQTPSSEIQTSAPVVQISEDEMQTIDLTALDQALQEAERYPKVTAYSPELAAVMRYNEITVRRYRISTEAAKMLEDQVREKYPEIWSEVSKRVQHKKRRR
jgi:hypothetical protein